VEDAVNQRVLIALVLFLVPVAGAQVYTVTDLGPLSPTSINVWGQVVGNFNGQGFIWTQFTGRKALGKLPGGMSSYASSVNDRGVVTGTADGLGTVISLIPSVPNQECSDLTQPFVWTPRNGLQGLGTVGGDWDEGYWCEVQFSSTGVNDSGEVVGYTGFASYSYALLWTSTNGTTLFGDSWPTTAANGISDVGQIVGQDATNELFTFGLGHATSWKSGVATDLGTLGGGADVVDYSSSANGVNDLGQVVGWSDTAPYPSGGPIHAVLWEKNGIILDLGTLAGDTLSAASNINFFGQVIGSSGNTLGFQGDSVTVIGCPFIWSARNGMQDLNSLISTRSGWVLNSATRLNIWGQIVGLGTRNGNSHGFLLTPAVF
jgi:probable HAF family extracellular repeat protein